MTLPFPSGANLRPDSEPQAHRALSGTLELPPPSDAEAKVWFLSWELLSEAELQALTGLERAELVSLQDPLGREVVGRVVSVTPGYSNRSVDAQGRASRTAQAELHLLDVHHPLFVPDVQFPAREGSGWRYYGRTTRQDTERLVRTSAPVQGGGFAMPAGATEPLSPLTEFPPLNWNRTVRDGSPAAGGPETSVSGAVLSPAVGSFFLVLS